MTLPRVIPVLLLQKGRLVKTIRFTKLVYVGDPSNAAAIFSELKTDELVYLDIGSKKRGFEPDFVILERIAAQCMMPVSYGGGLKTMNHVDSLFSLGFEKVVLRTVFLDNPDFVSLVAAKYGSQAVIVSIDVTANAVLGGSKPRALSLSSRNQQISALAHLAQAKGAGEILLTDVSREGTRLGLNPESFETLAQTLAIPLIANGGAQSAGDILDFQLKTGVSAVGVGHLAVFAGLNSGVMVGLPSGLRVPETPNQR